MAGYQSSFTRFWMMDEEDDDMDHLVDDDDLGTELSVSN
jgi:hypothetical protein